jgi:2',3'-cyclic-nucleotide 2'-phosphodiesterase (5'-nucleotidase family)
MKRVPLQPDSVNSACVMSILLMIASILMTGCIQSVSKRHTELDADAVHFVFMATTDIHSKVETFPKIGGLIAAAHQSGKIIIPVDAGDWFSGSIYSLLGPHPKSEFNPELEHFQRNDVVTTMGNHEFDATHLGLYQMLLKAQQHGYRNIVATNLEFEKLADHQFSPLRRLFDEGSDDASKIIHRRLLKSYRDESGRKVKVGFLGILGANACEGSIYTRKETGMRCIGFRDETGKPESSVLQALVQAQAKKLREDGAEIIVALVHGGHDENVNLTEPSVGIDFIVGGHTHEFVQAAAEGHSFYFQPGYYGLGIGIHEFALHFKNRIASRFVELVHTELAMTDTIDAPWVKTHFNSKCSKIYLTRLHALEEMNREYLARTKKLFQVNGITIDEELFHISTENGAPAIERKQDNLHAKLITSGIHFELNQYLKKKIKNKEIDLPFELIGYFIALDLIRGDFTDVSKKDGIIRFQDVFSIVSIGMQSPTKTGARLVVLELSNAEFSSLVTLFGIYSWLLPEATPVYSESIVLSKSALRFLPKVTRINFYTHFKDWDSVSDKVYVATTEFMADNLQRIPPSLFRQKRVLSLDITMEELFSNYLKRLNRAGIETLALPSEAVQGERFIGTLE